jgi:hypothetical protein
MAIDVPNAKPIHAMPIDEPQDFGVSRGRRVREPLQLVQDDVAIPEIAHRKLSDDTWVDQDAPPIE